MTRVALLALLMMTACAKREALILFDGIDFRTKTSTTRADRHAFATEVRAAGQNVAAAQKAGRYSATVYCAHTFGSSEIDWSEASAAAAEAIGLTAEGSMILQGRCAAR